MPTRVRFTDWHKGNTFGFRIERDRGPKGGEGRRINWGRGKGTTLIRTSSEKKKIWDKGGNRRHLSGEVHGVGSGKGTK